MRDSRRPVLAVYMGALFAFLYLPIAILVVLSFNDSKLATVWRGFSLRWYEELFRDGDVLRSIRTTLVIALAATLLSVAFGTLLAFGIERYTRSPAIENGVYLPLLIPDVVTGVGLLSFFATISLPLGTGAIIIAHSVWGTAFAAAIVRTRLRGFDRSIEEASLDLGVREVPTFVRITLPVIAPGIIAAALVVFTLSIDEFIIAYFTAGQTVTFPIQVYSMIRFGVTPEINAVATIMLLLSMLLIIGAYLIARPRAPRPSPADEEAA
jgi:spermidine/putrescine transport system permease protein